MLARLFVRRGTSLVRLGRPLSTVKPIEIEYVDYDEAGHRLLENPVYNKGQAFTKKERKDLGLVGLIPPVIETIEEQLCRAYESYKVKPTDLERHIYLRQLQDTNEVLFYALTQRHISEMLPIIYTPTVGLACQRVSSFYIVCCIFLIALSVLSNLSTSQGYFHILSSAAYDATYFPGSYCTWMDRWTH